MKLSPTQIETIRTFFQDKPVKKVYVFGSYARGDADENSDIDLLLAIDYETMKGGLWYYRLSNELHELLAIKVDVVSEDFMSPYIAPYILADRKMIYERAA